jgi:hypothetical protein
MPIATTVREAFGSEPTLDQVVDAVQVYAATLARLAEITVYHRDLEPDNLFHLESQWVVGDFGLVTWTGKQALTELGQKLGLAHSAQARSPARLRGTNVCQDRDPTSPIALTVAIRTADVSLAQQDQGGLDVGSPSASDGLYARLILSLIIDLEVPARIHEAVAQSDDEDHHPVDAQMTQAIRCGHAGHLFRPRTHSARVTTRTITADDDVAAAAVMTLEKDRRPTPDPWAYPV